MTVAVDARVAVAPAPGRATARRYPRWAEAVGSSVAGLWPVVLSLVVLWNPSRYNPYAVYSGLGNVPFRSLKTLPTTDPNIYATAYTLGVRAATMLVHGHLPWWNPFEGMGAPLAGELQSGAFFPFTPLLLVHDGSLIFHLALELVAGVATYWLLRELRCNPVVATLGAMLYATNGTFAWLGNAAVNPVCFLPLLLLGLERARRAALREVGGGWRWLAVGAAFALLAGFIETAALALVFACVLAVQRGWSLPRAHLGAFVRKVVAGLAAGLAIPAPLLVAFRDYLPNAYVYEHAGRAATETLPGSYLAMTVSPYLFGRLFQNAYPDIHNLWGGVGGYAGFALLALAVASLFSRRDRGLRLVLAGWVALSLADAVGLPGLRQLTGWVPLLNHVVLYRYLPPTWELALVVLAALAVRDLANATRVQALVAVTVGVLVTATVMLIGLSLAPGSLSATQATTSTSYDRSILLAILVAAALVLCAVSPRRVRSAALAAVAVLEAGLLFCIPLQSWPTHVKTDERAVRFLTANLGTARLFSLGPPSANFGSQVGLRQLDVVDLPVPRANVAIDAQLDPSENPTIFSGTHGASAGSTLDVARFLHHLADYERLGVAYVVAPTSLDLFAHRDVATLAYGDAQLQIWKLAHFRPLVRVPGCGLTTSSEDSYVVHCRHASVLLRTELDFPGWSVTVNGRAAQLRDVGRLQGVTVPAGRSVVSFTFLPAGVGLAAVATLLGASSLLVPWTPVGVWSRRRRARSASRRGLQTLGASMGRRRRGERAPDTDGPATGTVAPDGDPLADPVTSSVPAYSEVDDGGLPTSVVPLPGEEPATSVVPIVSDGPPTSVVPAQAGPPEDPDPPTMAVPRSGPRRPR